MLLDNIFIIGKYSKYNLMDYKKKRVGYALCSALGKYRFLCTVVIFMLLILNCSPLVYAKILWIQAEDW